MEPVADTGARKPALVLGGGGALGIIQAAYIEAAFELGFRPSIVVGTSVGALNGAWVGIHHDRIDQLLKVWLELDRLSLVSLKPSQIASRILHPLSVTTNDIVPKLLERHFSGARIEDAAMELAIVATNLTRGEKHVFRSGPAGQAILASTAIPGVFEPVTIDGDQFVDGCVTAAVDMTTAMEMGATEILAIDLTPPAHLARPKTAAGVLKQSFAILGTATTRAVETCLARQMPVRVLRPDLTKNSPWRVDDSAGSIARNMRLARESLHGVIDGDGRVAPEGTCWLPGEAADDGAAWDGPMRYFGVGKRRAG